MINLRGLGVDCDANPNDEVCRAFYDTPQQPPLTTAFQPIVTTWAEKSPNPAAGASAGAANAGFFPSTAAPPAEWFGWFKTWKGVAALGAAAAAAYFLFKKPSKSTPSPAAAAVNGLKGIFGGRRRRRRR